ncbi:hypothetical protein ACLOJK_039615 [Asimina triloba]
MRCSKIPCAFSFFSYLLVFLSFRFPTPAAADPLWRYCSQTPYNGSTFAANRDRLLSSLPSNASAATTGFADLTIGEAPNRVYGLAQCRGDTKGDECLNCLNTSREELPTACPNSTGAIWYEKCLVRYSDTQISSTSDSPVLYMWNTQNVTEPSRFNEILGGMMKGLISKAASVPSAAPLYATDQANFTSFETFFGLAQCNGNLLRSDCSRCLNDAVGRIPSCCQGKRGGRVIRVNCNIRFESYPFFVDSAAALEPLSTACPNTTSYNTDDAFGANLKSLFVSLTSEAAHTSFTVSGVGENPNQVHGLFLCRGDVMLADCGHCIDTASQHLLAGCRSRSAAMWYEACFLRYSDEQIIPSVTNSIEYSSWNMRRESSDNRPSLRWSRRDWQDDLQDLARTAAKKPQRFAARQLQPSNVEEGNTSLGSGKLYGLMQCTRDLSEGDCFQCLTMLNGQLGECCSVEAGGNLLGSSCTLMVEKTKFYTDTPNAESPPPQAAGKHK